MYIMSAYSLLVYRVFYVSCYITYCHQLWSLTVRMLYHQVYKLYIIDIMYIGPIHDIIYMSLYHVHISRVGLYVYMN